MARVAGKYPLVPSFTRQTTGTAAEGACGNGERTEVGRPIQICHFEGRNEPFVFGFLLSHSMPDVVLSIAKSVTL